MESNVEKQNGTRADLTLRPLGPTERWTVVMTHLKYYNNVNCAATISRSSGFTGDLRVLVYKALSVAVKRHTALATLIPDRETRTPYFVRAETIDLSKIVSFRKVVFSSSDTNQMDAILSEQSNICFDDVDSPVWRALILEHETSGTEFSFDFLLMWHHAIGDGKSGFAALSTFLEALNGAELNTNDETTNTGELTNGTGEASSVEAQNAIVTSSTRPLVLPVEDILEMRTTKKPMLQKVIAKCKSPFTRTKAEPGVWSGTPHSAESPIRFLVRHISIPEASLTRILNRCRAESTTLTSLLIAVIGKVILDAFEADSATCSVAMSVRRFFPPDKAVDDSEMGGFTSGFRVKCTRAALYDANGEATSWKAARENSQETAKQVKKGDMDLFLAAFRDMKDMKAVLQDKLGKPRDAGFLVSNVGAYPFLTGDVVTNTQGPWQLKDLVFAQSSNVASSALLFSVVGLKHGSLSIAVSWQVGVVADEDVNRILSQVNSHLLELSNKSS